MPRLLVSWLVCLLLGACGAPARGKPSPFVTPYGRAEWRALGPDAPDRDLSASNDPADSNDADRREERADDDGQEHPPAGPGATSSDDARDVREIMVAAAREIIDGGGVRDDLGLADCALALGQALPRLGWKADEGLPRLVDLARGKHAFDAGEEALPGDVVLFHNLADANGNGRNDDWTTGCGIVVDADGEELEVLARRGPRAVAVPLDARHADARAVQGRVVNGWLRIPARSDAPGTLYLAGQLYAGRVDVERLAAP